ncbi:hypothetical protein WJ03_13975 [Burkholderia vietnamiensis]|nr:hypothetical protein WJ03_13975 [Burkholderia vietnamiensis]
MLTMSNLAESLKDPALLRNQAYIAGEWSDAVGAAAFEVRDPATGLIIGTAPEMGATEIR